MKKLIILLFVLQSAQAICQFKQKEKNKFKTVNFNEVLLHWEETFADLPEHYLWSGNGYPEKPKITHMRKCTDWYYLPPEGKMSFKLNQQFSITDSDLETILNSQLLEPNFYIAKKEYYSNSAFRLDSIYFQALGTVSNCRNYSFLMEFTITTKMAQFEPKK